jgi:predicted Zn finger-like uncharacterized protein
MILTCPACASRYQVADGAIPLTGRTVRCASCSHAWRQEPEHRYVPPPLELAIDPPPPAPEPPEPPAAAIPKTIRARNAARRRTREAAVAGAVWGVLGALIVALVGGAALFRVEVVRLWPRTAGAYAKVGLPVNPTGLSPENVQAAPGLKDGRMAVIVTGVVRNVETRPHEAAPLRVSLLDKTGKPLARQVVRPAPGRIAPGQARPFSVAFLDPPSAGADVQVEFALELIGRPAAKPSARHGASDAALKLRGPAAPEPPGPIPVREAAPLPADSPYALPTATEANTDHPHDG